MRYPAAFVAAFVMVVGLISIAAPRAARAADETTQAREHFEKGKAYMDLGKYGEAAAEYEAAYAAKPDPALLLNLAQAYRQAGNADKALRFYRKYLEKVPKTPYRADIEEKIAALEKQVKTGEGTTAPTPANGTGTEPGSGTGQPAYNTAPPPPPPPPTGYGDPGAGNGAGPAGYPGYPMTTGAATQAPMGAPSAAVDHGKNLKLAGLIVGGVGVLSLVAAAVYGAQAKDSAKKIEDAAALGGTFDSDLQMQDSKGRSAQAKEITFLVVGVAAVAGGGVLYYLGTRKSKEVASATARRHIALLPAASPTEVGAALRVTF
jgi:tetratricopeptide (TPR) repeat protein